MSVSTNHDLENRVAERWDTSDALKRLTLKDGLHNLRVRSVDWIARKSPGWWVAHVLRIVGLIFILVAFSGIEAQGARDRFGDEMTVRLSRQPGLAWLGNFKETRGLDVAFVAAVACIIFSFFTWEAVVHRINHPNYEKTPLQSAILFGPGLLLICLDALLFGSGVYSGSSSSSPLPAAAFAAMYVAILMVFAGFISYVKGG